MLLSQTGVAPEQSGLISYWPLALHARGVVPLHVVVPGVHTKHRPAPLHVPFGQAVPCAAGTNPHWWAAVHVAALQALPDEGQSPTTVHCTQSPSLQSGVGAAQAGCAAHL